MTIKINISGDITEHQVILGNEIHDLLASLGLKADFNHAKRWRSPIHDEKVLQDIGPIRIEIQNE